MLILWIFFSLVSVEAQTVTNPSYQEDLSKLVLDPTYLKIFDHDGFSGATNSEQKFEAKQSSGDTIESDFYVFEAENEDTLVKTSSDLVNTTPQLKLNIIFIKYPQEYNDKNQALSLSNILSQKREVIYVFKKQPDYNELAKKFKESSTEVDNKPTVRFVIYRKPKEAGTFQKQILKEYKSKGAILKQKFKGPVEYFDPSKDTVFSIKHYTKPQDEDQKD